MHVQQFVSFWRQLDDVYSGLFVILVLREDAFPIKSRRCTLKTRYGEMLAGPPLLVYTNTNIKWQFGHVIQPPAPTNIEHDHKK